MSPRNYEAGLRGEDLARAWLEARGMTFVEGRFRAGRGEIDLVMRDGETLVLVEVKYRPGGRAGDGLTAVTPAKRQRFISAAAGYLAQREAGDVPVRFDVVEITADGVRHIPDAFRA